MRALVKEAVLEETKIFLVTYFAAVLGVVPPGLVNMSVAKTCVLRGRRNGVLVSVGASFIVLLQALLAILMTKYIFRYPVVNNMLLRAGLVIFVIMGAYFLIVARKGSKEVAVDPTIGLRSLLKGMGIALLNILPIPYFYAIGAAMNIGGHVEYHIGDIFIFVLAAALGTFSTLYLYVIFFMKIEEKAAVFSKYSNYFMAALMLILVIVTLIRIYYQAVI